MGKNKKGKSGGNKAAAEKNVDGEDSEPLVSKDEVDDSQVEVISTDDVSTELTDTSVPTITPAADQVQQEVGSIAGVEGNDNVNSSLDVKLQNAESTPGAIDNSDAPESASAENDPIVQQSTFTDTAPEPVSEPASKPVSEPASEPMSEPVSEPVSEPASEPAPEPVSEPVSEPASEPVSEPMSEPVSEPVSEPASEPVSESKPESKPEPEKTSEQHHEKTYAEVVASNIPEVDAAEEHDGMNEDQPLISSGSSKPSTTLKTSDPVAQTPEFDETSELTVEPAVTPEEAASVPLVAEKEATPEPPKQEESSFFTCLSSFKFW